MENYVITGRFKAGHSWENFTKRITSQNEKNAREKILSIIGSQHRLKRKFISLNSVTKE